LPNKPLHPIGSWKNGLFPEIANSSAVGCIVVPDAEYFVQVEEGGLTELNFTPKT